MWPPTKLYLGKPFHLAAGPGVPGASRGAKSNGAVMGGSLERSLFLVLLGQDPPSCKRPQPTARNDSALAMFQGTSQRGLLVPSSSSRSRSAG